MKIIFCINSLKERKKNLNILLPNIVNQSDIIHINSINYDLDLNDIKINKKNNILIERYDNMGSEGRLIHYNKYNDNDFYFTIDDDILYPNNYVDIMIKNYDKIDNSILCVHGSNLIKGIPDYSKRNVIHFTQKLNKLTKVEFPGVGTTCFKKGLLGLTYDEFKIKNMSDAYIGFFAKKQNINIYAIDRDENWLKPLNEYNVRIYGNNPFFEINNLIKNF